MKYNPYSHQVFAYNKILELDSVGLFLDMGLGKTVSTLTALKKYVDEKIFNKILIIAPKRIAESVWLDEINKWDHLNRLKLSIILGSPKERKRAISTKADLYIINRENLVWLVGLLGNSWPYDVVVIDELSSFKNPSSKRFKAFRLILPYIKKTIGLTGTPAPNGLLDLWSQLYILDKGKRLGMSFTEYRTRYFESDKRNNQVVFSYKLKEGSELLGKEIYEKEIMNRIGDICFSMKSEDYLKLPELIDNDQYIHLSKDNMKKYEDFERDLVLRLIDKELTAVNAAALMNKLLQFSNGAVYDEYKKAHLVHDEKMERLDEVIEELNGENALLFYSFVSDKERILNRYKQAKELSDSKDIKLWNDKKIKLFVLNAASAGHGLNLQFGGSNSIWFGLPWSLELYQQAVKRIHRPGAVKPVTNTRLIVKDTVEERVVEVLSKKTKMQNFVLEAVKAIMEKYI